MRSLLLTLFLATTAAVIYRVAVPVPPVPHVTQLAVVVAQDLSASGNTYSLPLLQEDEFQELLRIIGKLGGEVALGVIDGGDEPLLRFAIQQTSDNPYALQSQADNVKKFRDSAAAFLKRPLSNKTNLVAALRRSNTFFNESRRNPVRRILILVTDGVHDATREALPKIEPGVEVLLISGGARPKIPGQRFESIRAAIQSLN